ncbi:MAG: hypothetical protein ACQEUZ_04765 [Pseudomonadota bacterium]
MTAPPHVTLLAPDILKAQVTSYVSRVLWLTLLAPDIVEAIVEGRQPEGVTLAQILQPFPGEWARQRNVIG